jgi:Holliday junction resolvasome RuvABC endonuclease subunit
VSFIIGIDPGLRQGTGIALLDSSTRAVIYAASAIYDATTIVNWCDLNQTSGCVVAIERMTAMGAWKGSGNQASLDNAEFVGELKGRLSERGLEVALVTKRECLASIGATGKASAARVRKIVAALFGGVKLTNDHQRDAAIAAWCARQRARKSRAA